MAPFVKKVVALDTSKEMLEIAKGRSRAPNIIYTNHDIRNMDFEDEIFTKVTARMVFHHVLDRREKAVSEIYRVLKPNGLLILGEGIPFPGTEEWYFKVMSVKEKRVNTSVHDLKQLLERGGFFIETVHFWLAEKRNVNQWLENSSLNRDMKEILDLFRNAAEPVKKKCGIICDGESVFTNWLHIMLVASKRSDKI